VVQFGVWTYCAYGDQDNQFCFPAVTNGKGYSVFLQGSESPITTIDRKWTRGLVVHVPGGVHACPLLLPNSYWVLLVFVFLVVSFFLSLLTAENRSRTLLFQTLTIISTALTWLLSMAAVGLDIALFKEVGRKTTEVKVEFTAKTHFGPGE
jgi:hypothetical protein